jgi:hypothetical protein
MTARPDPTFHASPKLTMAAPPRHSPTLNVVDVEPGSTTYGHSHRADAEQRATSSTIWWNACSSALCR